ncbi:MAG: thioredoxin domain-containing protein [Elusimicrobiota bacterium]
MTIRRLMTPLLSLLLAAPALAAISREDLKRALDANPDLVLDALKKSDKSKFFTYVMESQQAFQKKKGEEEEKRMLAERESALKNPWKPSIGADTRVRGAKDATITIVEYSDFQCPYCKHGHNNMETLLKKYAGKMRVVFKNKPLPGHAQAIPAAQWFEAVALQSPEKAWTFHDRLFENQDKLGEDYYKKLAAELGVDVAKAAKDAKSEGVKKKIDADIQEAESFDITGTPAYIINGVPLRGAYPVEAFEDIIAKTLAAK